MIILWVLIGVLILSVIVCTFVLVGAIEHQTDCLLTALKSVGQPEGLLSAHGGTFTQLLTARAQAQNLAVNPPRISGGEA